jgi:chaperonin cofactor prefoldin
MPPVLPTPRSGSSDDLTVSDLRNSSMEAQVSSGVPSGQLQEGPWIQHLRRLILRIKHEEMSREEMDLFLNSEADTLQAFFEIISSRSVARGFILFGSEIGGISQELKEAEGHLEQVKLKLESTQQQFKKISRQYHELKEQLHRRVHFRKARV